MINALAFSTGVALVVVLVKATSYLAPLGLYFSFTSLFYDGANFPSMFSLAIKASIPFVVGLLLFWVPFRISSSGISAQKQAAIDIFLTKELTTTCYAIGFYSALLMSWPLVVHWDLLSDYSLAEHQAEFMSMYLMYFVSYGLLAGAGAHFALGLKELGGRPLREGLLKFGPAARDTFLSTIATGIATWMLSIIQTPY